MIFSRSTLAVGGMITIPASFMNSASGRIIGCTVVGINVVYNEGKNNQQQAFYSYAWLNQLYGKKEGVYPSAMAGDVSDDDLNDDVPF